MPLRETKCLSCEYEWEQILRYEERPDPCPKCGSSDVDFNITAFGGYSGSFGGGSTKPKNAGSFAGRKKT